MAYRRNCILVVGLLFLALTAHLHHAAQAAAGGGDGKNLVRWRKAMETPRHPSPVAPRRLRKYGRHGHFIGTGRPTSTTVSVSVSGEQKEGLAAMVAGGGGAEEVDQ
nr:hypothetical protein Iba_chr14bCG3180 [Ipomoea batatas]